MSLRRRLVDGVRRRVVPTASELEELRQRVRTAESELAQARQRIRSLERQLDQTSSTRSQAAEQVRSGCCGGAHDHHEPAPAQETEAPSAGGALYIFEEECVGCGTCVDLAPDAFQMDRARAVAEVVSQDAPADQVDEAIMACPTQCIRKGE